MSFYMIERARIKEPRAERGNYISFNGLYVAPEYSEELTQHNYEMRCAEDWIEWIRPLLENQACFNDRVKFTEFNWAC
jgi:hypothetical protein